MTPTPSIRLRTAHEQLASVRAVKDRVEQSLQRARSEVARLTAEHGRLVDAEEAARLAHDSLVGELTGAP